MITNRASTEVQLVLFDCAYKSQKKDKDRSKGKGRHFCLGGRRYSNPCHANCFALDDLTNRMNCTRIIYLGKILQLVRGKELNKFCPPNSSEDLCLFFCLNDIQMVSYSNGNNCYKLPVGPSPIPCFTKQALIIFYLEITQLVRELYILLMVYKRNSHHFDFK